MIKLMILIFFLNDFRLPFYTSLRYILLPDGSFDASTVIV